MIKDIPKLIDKVVVELKNFTDVAVIGLSGGADSTLVAVLCKLAFGRENVYGIHMPFSNTDNLVFNSVSKNLAAYLGIKDITIPINQIHETICEKIIVCLYTQWDEDNHEFKQISKLNEGNLRARLRTNLLYTFATVSVFINN